MNWRNRVQQLLDLDCELDTDRLLRKFVKDEKLHLVDHRQRLVLSIERTLDGEDEAAAALFEDDRQLRTVQ